MSTRAQILGRLVADAKFGRLDAETRHQLKIRVIDSIGCAFGALESPLAKVLREHTGRFGNAGPCTLIGGGRSEMDRAAFFNGALVRYLDYNDGYMGIGDYAHPSDNIGPVIAAAEYSGASGEDLLLAIAVAYQVQLRLVDAAPVLARGFDHTVQGAYALACGLSKAFALDAERTANAIAICGTSYNSLRVTRTGTLSNWKGLAYANTALGCAHAVLLAAGGVTGPIEVFEGNKGFQDTIAGKFNVDWGFDRLDAVKSTSLKKYNATIDGQSSVDAALEIHRSDGFDASKIETVRVDVFKRAFDVIGGGEEGDKYHVRTKEQADHSLRYMIACALLDGRMTPAQYTPDRILKDDVQSLLRKVAIAPDSGFSSNFPATCSVRIRVGISSGREFVCERNSYEGYFSQPMSWDGACEKFTMLTERVLSAGRRRELQKLVSELERHKVSDLTALLTP